MSETNDVTPLHTLKPLSRFSDRVDDYTKYRPSYPDAAINLILDSNHNSLLVAADIGAGTGISARQLAQKGVQVIAIEPNGMMRDAGNRDGTLIQWIDGTAEATNLPDASVDLVTCFQAFHWFSPQPTLSEFHRILKPSGRLAVVWNNRDQNDEFTAEYSRIVRVASNNHPAESRMKSVEPLLETSYFTNYHEYTFINQQVLDLHGLIGRAMSVSYIPREGKAHVQLMSDLENLYQHCNQQGFVTMVYCTSVHLCNPIKN